MPDISNEELVQKAVITADALASSGKLNTAQSNRFIDYVIDETALKDNARIIRFRNESLDIDKIGVGARLAVPKSEARDPGIRRGVTTSKITLTPKEIMVPFEIGDTFREINIEGDSIENHIISMMARQAANDIEELYINGNTLGPAEIEGNIVPGGSATQYIKDSYLALFDGWLKLLDSANIVDAEGANIGLSVFGKTFRAMPTKFRRILKDMRFYMAPDLEQIYYEKLSTRATSLGDSVAGGMGHRPFGIPIVGVPLLDFLPSITEHVLLGTYAAGAKPLANAPVQNVVVTPVTLDDTPTTPYVEDTHYTLDEANGTIRPASGQGLESITVKVTYDANPQILLTHMNNLIVGIGRDVRIEKDRDIFKGVNQYAITLKVAVQIEELTAAVKTRNVGQGV
jgi:hypothetical protein